MRVAQLSFHEEVFGLDGQGHCDCEAVGWVCFGEVEGLEEGCGGEDGFLPGEGSADAASCAIALERKERLGAVPFLYVANWYSLESLRMVSRHSVAERGRLLCTCAPGGKPRRLGRTPVRRGDISTWHHTYPHDVSLAHLWISVHLVQQEDNVLSALDHPPAVSHDLVALGGENQRWSRWVQAQSLAEACLEIWELAHVLERHGRLANYSVDFFLELRVCLRVLEERVEEEREQARGGFVAWIEMPVNL